MALALKSLFTTGLLPLVIFLPAALLQEAKQKIITETTMLHVRFKVIMASSMKMKVFWDIAQFSFAGLDRRFRRAYCVHYDGRGTPV
jgi:hypothetical protein